MEQISDALGETNPAGQHRPAANPFERFTALNRHSIVLAQEAARTYQHDLIGIEHLRLGLLSEPRGLAYEVLTTGSGSEQRIRDAIEGAMPPAGKKALRGHNAFGPDSKEAIEHSAPRPTSGTTGSAPSTRCWV